MSEPLRSRIIVLNYNGKDLLNQCLPSIVEAAGAASFPTRVTVLDNCSTDGSADFIRKQFPSIDLYAARENRVLCSYNDCVRDSPEPVVILLNNDIRVAREFVDPLIRKFAEDPSTFMAAPKVLNFDGSAIDAARTKARLRFGLFYSTARYPGFENDADQPSETFSSGFGAFSREKFLALGGYDDRFLPGIMEDADLCLRARRAGHHLYYEPRSIVYHMGQATFKKEYGRRGIEVLAHRNNFLFLWKNFSGPVFWIKHLFFLPFRFAGDLLRARGTLTQGFIEAVRKINS